MGVRYKLSQFDAGGGDQRTLARRLLRRLVDQYGRAFMLETSSHFYIFDDDFEAVESFEVDEDVINRYEAGTPTND